MEFLSYETVSKDISYSGISFPVHVLDPGKLRPRERCFMGMTPCVSWGRQWLKLAFAGSAPIGGL